MYVEGADEKRDSFQDFDSMQGVQLAPHEQTGAAAKAMMVARHPATMAAVPFVAGLLVGMLVLGSPGAACDCAAPDAAAPSASSGVRAASSPLRLRQPPPRARAADSQRSCCLPRVPTTWADLLHYS